MKSLGLAQTNRAERIFPARSLQVHTHLCRGSLSSGCRVSWPIHHAENAALRRRSLRLHGALSLAAPARDINSSLFQPGLLFQYGPLVLKTKLRWKKTQKPNLNPKPAEVILRPATARRGSPFLEKSNLKFCCSQQPTLYEILSGSQWTRQVWQEPSAATGPYSGFLVFPIDFFFF